MGRRKGDKNKHPWSADKKHRRALERYFRPRKFDDQQAVRVWRHRINTFHMAQFTGALRANGNNGDLHGLVAAVDRILGLVRKEIRERAARGIVTRI
jgi:hypothetical protein